MPKTAAFALALPQPPADQLRSLAQRAHRLAGAAGSFGEAGLSEAARRFEELCVLESAPQALAQALRHLADELERVLA